MKQPIFTFDPNKCVGCGACTVACMNENGFQYFGSWRSVDSSSSFPELPLFYLSMSCNHCEDAPCMKNCPALAFFRTEKSGAVLVDQDKCIGCKYCTWACPYDAPKFNKNLGVIEKCTFCDHRLEQGIEPACSQLCPTDALGFEISDFSRAASLKSSPVSVDVGSKLKIDTYRFSKGPEPSFG